MAESRSHMQVALTVLVVAEIPNFWSGFLPSLFTIATFSGGDEAKVQHTKRWIRRGEIAGGRAFYCIGSSRRATRRGSVAVYRRTVYDPIP